MKRASPTGYAIISPSELCANSVKKKRLRETIFGCTPEGVSLDDSGGYKSGILARDVGKPGW